MLASPSLTAKLPTTQTIVAYLCIMGGLTACALLFAFLLFVAYLAQLVLLSLAEVVHAFNALDPLVRLLLLALVFVLVCWRIHHNWRVRYGQHYQ